MENLVILVGRLGVDPELKYTPNETPVANMFVVTSEAWRDKRGEKKEQTEGHVVEVWNKLGKACAENLEKGSVVYIRGKLVTKTWELAQGGKSSRTIIKANKVKFL